MEETNTLKLSLAHDDGVWCEEVVVPELRLLRETSDHLVVVLDQSVQEGCEVTLYFGCVAKGRLHMPYSLKELHQKVRHSKVKMYHGADIELQVSWPFMPSSQCYFVVVQ